MQHLLGTKHLIRVAVARAEIAVLTVQSIEKLDGILERRFGV